MDEKPKSIWKKSWTGPRAFLFWLLFVSAAAFLTALLIAVFTSVRTTLFDKHSGLENLVGYTLVVMFGFVVAVAVVFILFGVVRWLLCLRNVKRALFGLACFATLIALFYAEENWRGKRAWANYQHEWEAKGEKFDLKDFIPPAVPEEKNFALTPVVSTCYSYILTRDGKRIPNEQRDTNLVNRLEFDLGDNNWSTNGTGYWAKGTMSNLKLWQEMYRDLATKTNLFAVAPQPQSPAADVLLALSKYDVTVEELWQASQLPESRFPLNYDTECPAAILLPHLAALKKCARLLQLRSIAELQAGQSEKALADVTLALRLADSVRTEPFLISHLVRIAMLQIMLQPVWEGLAERNWTDAQLVALDAQLAKLDFVADNNFALRGERGMDSGVIEYLRRAPNHLKDLASYDSGNETSENKFWMRFEMIALAYGPSGWYDQSKLRICQFYERWYLRVADEKEKVFIPSAVQGVDMAMNAEIKHWNPCRVLERMLLPALGGMARKCASAQISVDLARVAIALERHRLAHGGFPESLDALAPQFSAQVPHDVIGGQPLKYRRTSDGQFVLYSVGWNEKDDGGITGHRNGSTAPDFESGDWVWRYPAK